MMMRTYALVLISLALVACGGAPASVPVAAIASATPTPSPTAKATPFPLPVVTPIPTMDLTAVVVHLVDAIDELAGGAEFVDWYLEVGAWLQDPSVHFQASNPALLAFTSAMAEAGTIYLNEGDPSPAIATIVGLRERLAALAPSAVGPPPATPRPLKPVVVKGTGSQNSKPFNLPTANYTVVIAGKGPSNNVAVILYAVSGDYIDLLVNEISNGRTYRYETALYGEGCSTAEPCYYLDASMPRGAWSVTFIPMP